MIRTISKLGTVVTRPEGLKLEARNEEQGEVMGRKHSEAVSPSPSASARGPEERCKLPHRGLERQEFGCFLNIIVKLVRCQIMIVSPARGPPELGAPVHSSA